MDLLTVINEIEKGNIAPVYLVHGPEFFIVDQFINALKKTVVSGPMADFNYSRKKASETSGAAIVAECKSIPMMADRRLVIIDDAEKLKKDDQTALDLYLANPISQTCLVLLGVKFDLRRGLFSKANRRKQVHKAEALQERQLNHFISYRAKARAVTIMPAAQAAIAAAVGPDCAALDDAIEQVGLYAGEGATVTEDDVTEIVTAGRRSSVFELMDAIGDRHHSKAIALLEELLCRREEPLLLNALMARHIRQLLTAKMLVNQNSGGKTTAQALGVPPFVAQKLTAQAGRFKGAQLERSLGRLAETDLELKSSKRTPRLVLEQAILDLCFS